jgi:hypothetical protein
MLGGIGCAGSSHPLASEAAVQRWDRTELYFGAVPLEQWKAFLDHEVTPRFPQGLSWWDINGQWQNPQTGRIGKLPSRVLVIIHPPTAERSAALDEIRTAFKRDFHQISVLRVTSPVQATF